MLKKIALAAMALTVLAAATPAQAQYRQYEREPREGWFAYALENTRNVPFTIMESHERAMADIDRMYPRGNSRDYRRDRYDYAVRHRGESLGPYVWGRRYPWDSCSYNWNSRRTCRNTEIAAEVLGAGANVWSAIEARKLRKELERTNSDRRDIQAEMDDIDEAYDTRRDERPEPARAAPPGRREEPRTVILENHTGCKAVIGKPGRPLGVNGRMVVDPSQQIYAEVISDTCEEYLDPIGDGVIALKCR